MNSKSHPNYFKLCLTACTSEENEDYKILKQDLLHPRNKMENNLLIVNILNLARNSTKFLIRMLKIPKLNETPSMLINRRN